MASRSAASDRLPLPALLILAATGFVAITTELLPSGLLPQIGEDFGITESHVGLLTAGYAAVIVITVLPLTMLCARIPRKTLLVTLVGAFALSNVLIAASPAFPLALAARLIGGIAHGLLWSTMAPYVARIVPAHKVGRAMALVFSGNSLGLAIGAPLGTALGSVLGWRAGFLVLAAAVGLLALLAALVLPRVRRTEAASPTALRLALAQPGVKTVAAAWPLLLLAHFALFTYIAPFLQAQQLPDYTIGPALSVIGGAGLIGIWIAGMTVDSLPRRALILTTAAILAAFLLLPVGGGSIAGAAVLLTVWGTGLGAIGIYHQSAILRAGGPHRDAANGLTVLTIQLGIAIGAVYGGFAVTTLGPVNVPLAAALPVAASLALIFAGRAAAYRPGPREHGGRQPGRQEASPAAVPAAAGEPADAE